MADFVVAVFAQPNFRRHDLGISWPVCMIPKNVITIFRGSNDVKLEEEGHNSIGDSDSNNINGDRSIEHDFKVPCLVNS